MSPGPWWRPPVGVLGALVASLLVQRPQDAQAQLAALAKRHGIAITAPAEALSVETAHGRITGAPAKAALVDGYAVLFVREFGLYPPQLVQRAGLRRVVFCTELAFAGQQRGAVPDFAQNVLYLDVLRGRLTPDYVRRVIHHEFFHIVDWMDDQRLYEDPAWARLNPQGFAYGKGGVNAQSRSSESLLTDKLPGFLTHYATSGVEEDKAETFSWMMVNPATVRDRAEDDLVLAAKVARMRELLARFCPEVNEAFWRTVAERDAPAGSAPASRQAGSRPAQR